VNVDVSAFTAPLHAAGIPRATEPAPVYRADPRVRAVSISGAAPAAVAETTTLSGAAEALRDGRVSAVELVMAALGVEDAFGIFLARYDEAALATAERVDADLAAGRPVGALAGLPLGIKDLLTTVDGPTSAGSLIPPDDSGRDATAVARLRSADAVLVGKTLTSEYGVGSPDESKPFPTPRNPWDPSRWTGGSSAGTAAGLVVGAMLGGLGTDSGGSIRMPAAFCGVTGLKPTYGRVPRTGGLPLGWSTDHVGPMATTARDCALLLEVIAGADRADRASATEPVPAYSRSLTGELGGVRIGVDRLDRVAAALADPALVDPALAAVFAAALDVLTAAGADLIEVELPLYPELAAASTVITLSEGLAYHRAALATRAADFYANTRATIGLAEGFSAADYVQAQRVRRAGQDAVAALFERVDLIVTPTAAVAATPYARLDQMFDSGEFFAVYAPYWNVVGNPALSVPMGFTAEGMPLGLQVIGAPFDEANVLRAGDAYQARTGWHRRRPYDPKHADSRGVRA
jgi:aspartyl-tRNA(Asn)/glutamyl-tRNA(Gln) amidotransferase subunit A